MKLDCKYYSGYALLESNQVQFQQYQTCSAHYLPQCLQYETPMGVEPTYSVLQTAT